MASRLQTTAQGDWSDVSRPLKDGYDSVSCCTVAHLCLHSTDKNRNNKHICRIVTRYSSLQHARELTPLPQPIKAVLDLATPEGEGCKAELIYLLGYIPDLPR